ncbi:hypothetical protein OSH10_05605 [Kaistia defluvii]|uniref:hypothetical protein n=1 Tax=Kaistia defluvii TaxID=410841 RepID=UPI002254B3D2|nr:hypothetical protein [Kaistia defluvii]MCX5517903.1 hypothetical protein [Kaistia defluvii]
MSYRFWLASPDLALSLQSPRAGLARGKRGAPRVSSLILGLTVSMFLLALVVDLFNRWIAAT